MFCLCVRPYSFNNPNFRWKLFGSCFTQNSPNRTQGMSITSPSTVKTWRCASCFLNVTGRRFLGVDRGVLKRWAGLSLCILSITRTSITCVFFREILGTFPIVGYIYPIPIDFPYHSEKHRGDEAERLMIQENEEGKTAAQMLLDMQPMEVRDKIKSIWKEKRGG